MWDTPSGVSSDRDVIADWACPSYYPLRARALDTPCVDASAVVGTAAAIAA
jgi:hypothetical protein